jgi:endo-alpha-1,4-polygalactosaminidase (GH114 family)
VEAGAIVAALRRSTAAAAARASERLRAAEALGRAGRRDAFAMGVADAAQLLAERAAAETRRLDAALREEERLRARVSAARAALDPEGSISEEGAPLRVRCG